MTTYKKEDFCPYNDLAAVESKGGLWKHASELLGKDRMAKMIYENHAECAKGNYICDILTTERSPLGIELATALAILFPECGLNEKGRNISLHDLINPYQIPYLGNNSKDEFISKMPQKTMILQDNQFVVGIVNGEEKVDVYMYKK